VMIMRLNHNLPRRSRFSARFSTGIAVLMDVLLLTAPRA
jgi:hypothetical protein